MNTDESSDLGTESNNPTKNEGTPAPFDQNKLADLVSKTFLSGEEREDSSDSENSEAEVQATSEDSEVHSQYTEKQPEQDGIEDSEETEETKSEDDDFERGLPKGVKKRIDKLSAKRREAEAEVQKLREEVERLSQEASKPAQVPTKKDPYANLSTLEEVSREAEQAKQIRRWCEMNPDGAVVRKPDGEEVEYTAEEVRKIKVKAMDALEEHLPARANYLQNFQQIEQVASKEYPWWKDRSSSERQIAESFLKHFPEIQRFPDYKMVLGDYIRGVKARESSQKNIKGFSQKAPTQPRPSAAPARLPQQEANTIGAKKRFMSSGNRDDLSSIIANRFL
jgi:hypothetical protein